LEKHPNTLAIDLMSGAETSRRLKRKLPQDLCIYVLQDLYKLSNVLLNVTRSLIACNNS